MWSWDIRGRARGELYRALHHGNSEIGHSIKDGVLIRSRTPRPDHFGYRALTSLLILHIHIAFNQRRGVAAKTKWAATGVKTPTGSGLPTGTRRTMSHALCNSARLSQSRRSRRSVLSMSLQTRGTDCSSTGRALHSGRPKAISESGTMRLWTLRRCFALVAMLSLRVCFAIPRSIRGICPWQEGLSRGLFFIARTWYHITYLKDWPEN